MEKTIKIREDLYKKLNSLVGELRMREGKPVSINYALAKMIAEKEKRKVSDFAGGWSMTDSELKEIRKGLRKAWRTWKIG